MMTVANTAVCYIAKVLTELILTVLITSRTFFPPLFFFSFYHTYLRRWMLAETIVVIVSQYT